MLLLSCVAVTLGMAFVVHGIISKKKNRVRLRLIEEQFIEEKNDRRARLWENSLKQLGEKTDFELLLKESNYSNVPSDCITYEAVFTKNEYVSIVRRTRPETNVDKAEAGYKGWFKFENLEVAIFAKHLSNHIHKLKHSIETLKNKDEIVGISKKAQHTLNQLEEEKEASLKKLKAVVRFKEDSAQPEFSDLALIDESELIQEIEQGVLSEKPTIQRLALNEPTTTSPALLELNEFLLQNTVPQAISETLTDTMNQITHKLKQELETAKIEALTMEANALNRSAKQFHGIEE